ncbi:MAG: hypothetical protein ACXAD7_10170 [Candidatus Kariarchaeaceae archaeon]|jgi:hypothetical protein
MPLVPDDLYYRITEIEVLTSQINELLDEMVSFMKKNSEDLTELTQNTIIKLEKTVSQLKVQVGF